LLRRPLKDLSKYKGLHGPDILDNIIKTIIYENLPMLSLRMIAYSFGLDACPLSSLDILVFCVVL
jgi:hypothetical protein